MAKLPFLLAHKGKKKERQKERVREGEPRKENQE